MVGNQLTSQKLVRSLVAIGVLVLLISGCCFGSLPGMSAAEPLAVCQHATSIHDAAFADDTPAELARVESECVTSLLGTQATAADQYATIASCVMAVSLPTPGDTVSGRAAEDTLSLCGAPSHMVMVASCANDVGVCSEWSGPQWLNLGFDNASRAAAAPSNSFPGCATTFRTGQACSLTGVFGRCVAADRTTYYSNAGNAALVQDACSFMNGTWVAM